MKAKKTTQKLSIEIELLNPETNYPNYRYTFGSREEFLDMIINEIKNVVTPDMGARIKVTKVNDQ